MFTNEIALYGVYGEKAKELKEIGLFDRILDVFLTAGVVGIIYGKKGIKKAEQTSVKIFAGQLNNELARIRYLSSLAYLIENYNMKGDETTEKELLRQTFGDWFGECDVDSAKKYELFELYALEGINILYDKIIGDKSDKDRYYENFYSFIEEINSIKIIDEIDRTFLGALNL